MTEVLEQVETSRVGWWRWAHWPAAGLLLFAAFMKWKQLPVIDRMGADLLHDPYVSAGQIVAEAGLAIWLICEGFSNSDLRFSIGKAWRWRISARRVAMVAFGLFACVAAYRGIVGEESCGCFGEFKVNPWITFVMDLAVAGMLLAGKQKVVFDPEAQTRRESRKQKPEGNWRVAVGAAALLAVVLLTGWRVWDRPALADDGLVMAGNLIVLEPEQWAGKPLPILHYLEVVDGGSLEELMAGPWRVVLYNSDCGHCRQVVPRLVEGLKAESRKQKAEIGNEFGAARWCFVRVPGSDDEELVPVGSGAMRARLTGNREWFAATPGIVDLADGLVTAGAEGKAAERRIEEIVRGGPAVRE